MAWRRTIGSPNFIPVAAIATGSRPGTPSTAPWASASSPSAAPSSSSRSRDGSSDRHPHHRRLRGSVQSDDVARTRPGHTGHTRARSGTGTSETETMDGQSRQSFTRDIGRMFTQTCTSPGTAGLSSPWPLPSPKKIESQHSID